MAKPRHPGDIKCVSPAYGDISRIRILNYGHGEIDILIYAFRKHGVFMRGRLNPEGAKALLRQIGVPDKIPPKEFKLTYKRKPVR